MEVFRELGVPGLPAAPDEKLQAEIMQIFQVLRKHEQEFKHLNNTLIAEFVIYHDTKSINGEFNPEKAIKAFGETATTTGSNQISKPEEIEPGACKELLGLRITRC